MYKTRYVCPDVMGANRLTQIYRRVLIRVLIAVKTGCVQTAVPRIIDTPDVQRGRLILDAARS